MLLLYRDFMEVAAGGCRTGGIEFLVNDGVVGVLFVAG